MRKQFQVIRDGEVIFRRDFAIEGRGRLAGVSKVALARFSQTAIDDFMVQFPGVSLLDDDVTLKLAEVRNSRRPSA
jgi:hypothetical protein